MTIEDALSWFENRVPKRCSDCPRSYDFTCSGEHSRKCAAYRIAIEAIATSIKNTKGYF